MNAPARVDLSIEAGATFRRRLRWTAGAIGTPIDLTGCTARMQLRAAVASPTVLANLTSENGGIALGGIAGPIDLHIPAATTAALEITAGVWDLELVAPDGDVRRLAEGTFRVNPEITR